MSRVPQKTFLSLVGVKAPSKASVPYSGKATWPTHVLIGVLLREAVNKELNKPFSVTGRWRSKVKREL